MGHAFKAVGGTLQSAIFAHRGSGKNLVGMKQSETGELEVEHLATENLRAFVLQTHKTCASASEDPNEFRTCVSRNAKLPKLGIVIPDFLLRGILQEYSPEENVPSFAESVSVAAGERSTPDGLVFINSLPYRVEVRWAWLQETPENGIDVPMQESRLIGTLEAAADPLHPSSKRLKTIPQQTFFVVADNGLRHSKSFVYPRELSVAAIREDTLDSKRLEVELLDEDALKVALSDASSNCGDKLAFKSWQSCFIRHARLPTTNILIPDVLSVPWFMQLWETLDHWRLCAHQDGGVDRGNPQGKDFRGVEGYLKGIWGNPSLVKINGKTQKNKKNT